MKLFELLVNTLAVVIATADLAFQIYRYVKKKNSAKTTPLPDEKKELTKEKSTDAEEKSTQKNNDRTLR